MIRRRKYKIRFIKYFDPNTYEEVTDATILEKLLILKEKYNFDIKYVRLKSSDSFSCICIECENSEKSDIFSEFCVLLGGYIDLVSF